MLEAELPVAVEKAAAEQARALAAAATEGTLTRRRRWTAVAGVLALIERNRRRRDRLFAQLVAGWLGEGRETDRLAEAVEAVAARLEAGISLAEAPGRGRPARGSGA